MTYDEILKVCIERAPDDQVLQDAFDELIYQHVGTDKTASAINNAGAERQVEVLKEKGYATPRILIEIAEQLAISVHTLGERVSSPAVPVAPVLKMTPKVKPAPVLKRVRILYEVLCAVDNTEVQNMGLADIQMACEEHGTDTDFFELPEFAVGSRVFWTDPDHGACSAHATVVGYNHPVYQLVNDAGGEIECEGHELRRGRKKQA